MIPPKFPDTSFVQPNLRPFQRRSSIRIIVIPVYNEGRTISRTLAALARFKTPFQVSNVV
jgi:hypothetical protein